MKLTTVYDENVINQYMKDNDGMGATNRRFWASVEDLTNLLGKPTGDWREETLGDVQIFWIVRDEETGKLFKIWVGDWGVYHNYDIVDEELIYWKISTDGAIHYGGECAMDKPANELSDYILNNVPRKKRVFAKPSIDKRRIAGGVNDSFSIDTGITDIGSENFYEDKVIHCGINRNSKLYKRFYSKLTPELQEEFNILIGESMAYICETKYNMPKHCGHAVLALSKILNKYNRRVSEIDKEKRKANKK